MMDKAGIEPNSDGKQRIGSNIKSSISIGY
jgi:hypothetical protein